MVAPRLFERWAALPLAPLSAVVLFLGSLGNVSGFLLLLRYYPNIFATSEANGDGVLCCKGLSMQNKTYLAEKSEENVTRFFCNKINL